MLINEVCKECRLTKKAIEYYEERGLISPAIKENGYRLFSQADVARLKKIALLRGLGLSVLDIQTVLTNKGCEALRNISDKLELDIVDLQAKQRLIEKLARDNEWDEVRAELESLEKKHSIIQRLLGQFPGFYGKFLSLHFAPFLSEPITTNEQLEAFETIIDFLDNVNIVIPKDLQEYFDEVAKDMDNELMERISAAVPSALQNIEQYMEDNREVIEKIKAIKQSDEYKQSPVFRLQETFKQFNSESGYYDIFIPAMRRLSKSYQKYYDSLRNVRLDLIDYPYMPIKPLPRTGFLKDQILVPMDFDSMGEDEITSLFGGES